MFSKGSTHGFIGGVIKSPFYVKKHTHGCLGQAPSHPEPRADDWPFPQISQLGMRVGWDVMA
jgi:hypothetical protein